MRLIEETDDSIVVECEKCKRNITKKRNVISLINDLYFGELKCDCGNFASSVEVPIKSSYRDIQTKIDGIKKSTGVGMTGLTESFLIIGGVLLFILGLVLGLALMIKELMILMPVCGGVLFFFGIFMSSQNDKERVQKLQEENLKAKEVAEKEYRGIKKSVSIPYSYSIVNYCKGDLGLISGKQYLWVENNSINLFPYQSPDYEQAYRVNKIKKLSIAIEKIICFKIEGEVIHENKITGGGGGGSSLGGAIVGGAVAGGAGAVIGSRKKVSEIKSELVKHDTREVHLKFLNDDGETSVAQFDLNSLEVFEKHIPEKGYEIVKKIAEKEIVERAVGQSFTNTITDQIRELAKLKDEGILTEEEFTAKKKVLLAKI